MARASEGAERGNAWDSREGRVAMTMVGRAERYTDKTDAKAGTAQEQGWGRPGPRSKDDRGDGAPTRPSSIDLPTRPADARLSTLRSSSTISHSDAPTIANDQPPCQRQHGDGLVAVDQGWRRPAGEAAHGRASRERRMTGAHACVVLWHEQGPRHLELGWHTAAVDWSSER